ncbi:hypothetical protein BpHYR1_039348 [Brachionus plicatilis]|uniref:Uncharacterized protein n=1 Tax=Brachionus plicatilis TaxID=10195 RepID=A0A3M7SUM2_BRAPC|nr:hypothetical protein BpHYR1_039348 [Brachionus plicatilis]
MSELIDIYCDCGHQMRNELEAASIVQQSDHQTNSTQIKNDALLLLDEPQVDRTELFLAKVNAHITSQILANNQDESSFFLHKDITFAKNKPSSTI